MKKEFIVVALYSGRHACVKAKDEAEAIEIATREGYVSGDVVAVDVAEAVKNAK